jgi:hypothetical protein
MWMFGQSVWGSRTRRPLSRRLDGYSVACLIMISLMAMAAAYAQWIAPDLPLYGNDHERGDLAP